jgi:hypothetical protein
VCESPTEPRGFPRRRIFGAPIYVSVRRVVLWNANKHRTWTSSKLRTGKRRNLVTRPYSLTCEWCCFESIQFFWVALCLALMLLFHNAVGFSERRQLSFKVQIMCSNLWVTRPERTLAFRQTWLDFLGFCFTTSISACCQALGRTSQTRDNKNAELCEQ